MVVGVFAAGDVIDEGLVERDARSVEERPAFQWRAADATAADGAVEVHVDVDMACKVLSDALPAAKVRCHEPSGQCPN